MMPRSKKQGQLKGKSWAKLKTIRRNTQAWCRLFSKAGRVADKREIREQQDLPSEEAFRSLRPAGAPWTLSTIRIEGAVLWVVTCIDENDPWGPRLGVTLLPEPNAKATSRPLDAWVLFGHEQRVVGTIPRELEAKVLSFVDFNLEALLAHWVGDIDSVDLIHSIGPD